MDSSIVIKVKYAETVRRFSTRVEDGKFDLNMDRLREKIVGLFKFSPGTELTITYIDEDGDVVTLADDEDLHDVVRQGLNPLRITVNMGRSGESSFSSGTSGNFMQLTSLAWLQQLLQNLNSEDNQSSEDPLSRLQQLVQNLNCKDCPSWLQQLVRNFYSEDPLSRFFMLMNQFAGHQSGLNAPAHGVSTNETVSGDTRNPNINEARESGVAVPAATANVQSNNQSENVLLKTDEVKSQSGTAGARKIPGLESIRDALASVSGESSSSVVLTPSTLPQTDIGMIKSIKQPPSAGTVPPSAGTVPPSAGAVPPSAGAVPPSAGAVPPSLLKLNSVSDCFPRLANGVQSSLNIQNSQPISTPCDDNKSGGVLRSLLRNSSTSNPIRSRYHRRGDHHVFPTFHWGIGCDGCGVHPITGFRFKSKVKEDYDLCSICFGHMGNEEDYIRLDRPLTYHKRPIHCKRSFEPRRSELDSIFTQDVTISDGTLIAPSVHFTKIWRMKNNGADAWPRGTQLVWIGGDKLTDIFSVVLPVPEDGLPVGEELDIAVDFVAPRHPGQYISYWRMISPSGHKFGQRVWVLIQVDANELPLDSYYSFNLNLPPVSNGVPNPETVNVNPEPTVKNSLPDIIEFVGSSGTADLVEPIVALPVQKEEEQVNLPINDSLFVGGAVSKPNVTASSSSFSYPIVDLPEMASSPPPSSSISYPIVDLLETAAPSPASVPSSEPVPLTVVQTSSTDLGLTPEVEETLLRDLEEMGFREVDLNKEILRLNEYDLEKSVDDLCGVSEWDPILDELKEMGFCDKEKNRILLKKNNGSVKRVVMDLLGGEKMM